MPGSGDETTRSERWAASMSAEMDRAAWERRQEEHWERLHKQLYWLPWYFVVWSVGLTVAAFIGALALGISLAGLGGPQP